MGAPGAIQAQSLAPPEVTKGQEDVGLDAVLADLTGQVSWLGLVRRRRHSGVANQMNDWGALGGARGRMAGPFRGRGRRWTMAKCKISMLFSS